jgi:hypothetical protein
LSESFLNSLAGAWSSMNSRNREVSSPFEPDSSRHG